MSIYVRLKIGVGMGGPNIFYLPTPLLLYVCQILNNTVTGIF